VILGGCFRYAHQKEQKSCASFFKKKAFKAKSMETISPGQLQSEATQRDSALVAEASADVLAGRIVSLKSVKAWVESLGTTFRIPPPWQR
jgi:hypothetical protein